MIVTSSMSAFAFASVPPPPFTVFCIAGVQKLSSMTTSVTLNLVLGIRKFISLILSVLLFSNDFTAMHGLGTSIVAVGTVLYGMS